MTAVQGLLTPQTATEDAMEVSTEAEQLADREDDIDLDLDLVEDQHEDSADQDMTEEFEERQFEEANSTNINFESGDAFMEEAVGEVAPSPLETNHDEEIQDAGTAASERDDEVIVDDLVDESEQGFQALDGNAGIDSEVAAQAFHKPPAEEGVPILPPDFDTESTWERQEYFEESTTEQKQIFPPTTEASQGEQSNYIDGHEQLEQQEEEVPPGGPQRLDDSVGESQSRKLENSGSVPIGALEASSLSITGKEEFDNQSAEDDGTNHDPRSHLHPIIVLFQGSEMFLFPPVDKEDEDSPTYLLSDESLATKSVQDGLSACRTVLEEDIEEDDELELTIDELDLQICEFTSRPKTLSIAQIVELYLQLCRNDGIDSPRPLYVQLCIKSTFSHRWKDLLGAVSDGKGLAALQTTNEIESYEDSTVSFRSDRPADASSNEVSDIPDLARERDPEGRAVTDQGDGSAVPSLAPGLLQQSQQHLDGAVATQLDPCEYPHVRDKERTEIVETNCPVQSKADDDTEAQDEAQNGVEKVDVIDDKTRENPLDLTIDPSALAGDESSAENARATGEHVGTDISDLIASGNRRNGETSRPLIATQGEPADTGSGSPDNNNRDDAEEDLFDELGYNTNEERETSNEDNLMTNEVLVGGNGIAKNHENDEGFQESHSQAASPVQVHGSDSLPNPERDQRDRVELRSKDTSSQVEDLGLHDDQYLEDDERYRERLYPAEFNDSRSGAYGDDEALLGRELMEADIEQQPRSITTQELLEKSQPLEAPHGQQNVTVFPSNQIVQQEPTLGHIYESATARSPGSHKRPRHIEEESEGLRAELQDTKRVRST